MSTRKSSRLRTQPKAEAEDFKYETSGDEYSDEDVAGPSTSKAGSKRKRKPAKELASTGGTGKNAAAPSTTLLGVKYESGRPTKKFRGKRGFLQQIAEMPLELLFEIFGKLDPIDVLHLSRTTKSLRAILMRKSAADIWKASLENMEGLPPAPEDLSEPRWVDLLFGKNCHICGRTTSYATQTYAWEARLRGCSKCVVGEFTFTQPSWAAYVPTFQLTGSARRSERGIRWHINQARQLELDKSYNDLKTAEERAAWVLEKTEAKKRLSEHAKLCSKWLTSQRDARTDALEDIRVARKAAMREKIEGMGYNSTLVGLTFDEPSFWSAPCVAATLKKDVSDRTWAATEAAFADLMDGFKDRLAKQQREKHIKKRFDTFLDVYRDFARTWPLDEAFLTAADLFQSPGVKDVVLAEPIEEDVEASVMEEFIVSRIPEFQAEWIKTTTAKMVEQVKKDPILLSIGLEKEDVDESTLGLAVVLFRCSVCYSADCITGTNLPFHACPRELRHRSLSGQTFDRLGEDMKLFIQHTRQIPWDLFNSFTLSGKVTRAFEIIKTKLKLDHATLTAKAIDELDPVFEHVSGGSGRSMYSWRGLVGKPAHLMTDLTAVVLIEDEELKTAIRDRLNESMRKARAESYNGEYLHCTRCRKYKAYNASMIRTHLKDTHGFENITDEDIWVHPDEANNGRLMITYYTHPGVTVI